ncbi:NB-ARC domain-containing protein [Thiothrix caldifontis]|uniref:NB-ARC domain-containing protein n=1 Tax=Thiothrix caldifontis TaxID=525918 RepID=A0A1H4GZ17_9GAMM|nr:TIR domain-containing protein [Thiothrix caldifontis]SEB14340.1 NB-ARC domain-containing protein [Thiothrix caldifontis]
MDNEFSNKMHDIFISRAGEDKEISINISHILNKAGYRTYLQDEDFGHTSFMARMEQGFQIIENGGRLIALLSSSYQKKEHCMAEAHYPLIDDPQNKKQRLIVFRIDECAPSGFLKPIPYIDLVPILHNVERLEKVVESALTDEKTNQIDSAKFYRRSGNQIMHSNIHANKDFISREIEFEALNKLFSIENKENYNSETLSVAITGIPGVGKSTFAKEYAWRNRENYQGIWWIKSETPENLLDDIVELGNQILPITKEISNRAKAAQVTLDHLSQTQWRLPWLLIFDNVVNPIDIDGKIPKYNAHILITTRWQDWYERVNELTLELFSPNVSSDFLMSHARNKNTEEAIRLSTELGHLPLALSHARSLCWKMAWSFEQYSNQLPKLIHKSPRDATYPSSIFATFDLAIKQATSLFPKAWDIMAFLAFMDPDRIPISIIPQVLINEVEKGEAIAALSELSLISIETLSDGSRGVSVHRLVQTVMRERLGKMSWEINKGGTQEIKIDKKIEDITLNELIEKVVHERESLSEEASFYLYVATASIAIAFPEKWENQRLEASTLYPHAIAVLSYAPAEFIIATEQLLRRVSSYLIGISDWKNAAEFLSRVIRLHQRMYGEINKESAHDRMLLGNIYQFTNLYDKAKKTYHQALLDYEELEGKSGPGIAASVASLAHIYAKTGDIKQAMQFAKRAYKLYKSGLGATNKYTVNMEKLIRKLTL